MIKVGLVGAGFIGHQQIEAIKRIPNVELVAVSDRNAHKLDYLVQNGVCKRGYLDFDEMLKNEDLDVVHNCLPTNKHFEINKKLIEKGINVYSEKPLVKTIEEAEILMKLLDKNPVVAGVNFNYRHNAMVQEMKVRIKNGDIGRPLFLQSQYIQDWLMYESDYDWRMDLEIGGPSRALSDIGSHAFDLAQYVLADSIKRVNAKLFTVYPTRNKSEGSGTFAQTKDSTNFEKVSINNEDGGVVQVEFESGLVGVFTISQVSAGKKNDLQLNVSGSKQALEWKQEQPDRLWIGNRSKGNEEIYADANYLTGAAKDYATLPNGHAVGWHDALTNGIRSFYRAVEAKDIEQEGRLFATFKDGYQIMKIVDACLKSNKEDKWIEI